MTYTFDQFVADQWRTECRQCTIVYSSTGPKFVRDPDCVFHGRPNDTSPTGSGPIA